MKLRTPENQNGSALPVARLDFGSGIRISFTSDESSSTADLPAGVYVVSVTADAFLAVGTAAEAGDAAGSMPVFAGAWSTLVVKTGEVIAVRGMADAGSLFAIPLEVA